MYLHINIFISSFTSLPRRAAALSHPRSAETPSVGANTATLLLTVQSHVVVGEDGRFVPFGCAADDHMQHSIRGLDVMFLPEKKKHKHTISHLRRIIAATTPVPGRRRRPPPAWSVKRFVRDTRKWVAFTSRPAFLLTCTSRAVESAPAVYS